MICLRVELSGEINKRASLLAKEDAPAGCFLRQQRAGNFELATNFDYVHEGQRTLAKVCVGVGSQAYPGAHKVLLTEEDSARAGFGITGRKTEKAGKNLKKWLAFLERECYTVRRTFVNAFFFCAQKTGVLPP